MLKDIMKYIDETEDLSLMGFNPYEEEDEENGVY